MSARKAVNPVAGQAMTGMDLDLADRRRVARSFAASLLLWSIAFLLAALVPLGKPREKRAVYREVAISLASPRSTSTVASATNSGDGEPVAPAKRGTSSSARANSGEQATPASPANAGRASPKKTSTAQAGLGIPDFAPATGKKASAGGSSDTLEFGNFEGSSADRGGTATIPGGTRTVVPEIEGSVASVKKGADGPVSATARASRGGEAESVSAETARELGGISGSRPAESGTGSTGQATGPSGGKTAGSGTTGSEIGDGAGLAAGTGAGSGQVSSVSGFAFEGRPRGRLYPSTVSIVLPENLSRLVDSNRTVTVRLTVLADGTVPAGFVTFTPQAALPAEIRDYLAREFSRWRFEKSDQDGQARFSYSIRVQ